MSTQLRYLRLIFSVFCMLSIDYFELRCLFELSNRMSGLQLEYCLHHLHGIVLFGVKWL